MNYHAFGLEIPSLSELEWRDATAPGQDGESWIIREKGGSGYEFRASLSDRQRNSAPEGTPPIERDDVPTPGEIQRAIAIAIERDIVSGALDSMEKGKEYPVTVTSFDLYEAAEAD